MHPPTFPARPVNGGPFDKSLPKNGDWFYEPKYNGWRALVHVPTGTMFNRKNERLTIEGEFRDALRQVRNSPFVWLDVEALERRHGLGQGSLVVFDWITLEYSHSPMEYRSRKNLLRDYFLTPDSPMGLEFLDPVTVQPNRAYLCPHVENHGDFAMQLWDELKSMNSQLGCEFFEGVVAKRADSLYPLQLRSSDSEFPFWMKHRWAY